MREIVHSKFIKIMIFYIIIFKKKVISKYQKTKNSFLTNFNNYIIMKNKKKMGKIIINKIMLKIN